MAIKKVTEEITLQPSDAEIPEDRIAELRRKAQAEALEARRKKLEDDASKSCWRKSAQGLTRLTKW
jgi:hypothetical protein